MRGYIEMNEPELPPELKLKLMEIEKSAGKKQRINRSPPLSLI